MAVPTGTAVAGRLAAFVPPRVVGDVVLVRFADEIGMQSGKLLALDAQTGTERWQVDLGLAGRIVPGGDAILAVTGATGEDRALRALSPADGAELWALESPISRNRSTSWPSPATPSTSTASAGPDAP